MMVAAKERISGHSIERKGISPEFIVLPVEMASALATRNEAAAVVEGGEGLVVAVVVGALATRKEQEEEVVEEEVEVVEVAGRW